MLELIKYCHELSLIPSSARSSHSVRAAVHSRGSRSGQRARDWSTAAHAEEDHFTSSTDVNVLKVYLYVLKVRKKPIMYSEGHNNTLLAALLELMVTS